jgi:hypothetical protein
MSDATQLRADAEHEAVRNKLDQIASQKEALKGGGGGGTFNGMDPASKEYVDMKVEAAISRIEGKFDLLNQRMDNLERNTPSALSIWGAVFTGSVAVVGLLLAALAYGGDRFDGGVSIAEQMRAQSERDAAQDAKMNEVFTRLDAAVDRLATPAPDQTEATPGE